MTADDKTRATPQDGRHECDDDLKLDQILGGGSLGRPQFEAIFREVLRHPEVARSRRFAWWRGRKRWFFGAGAALTSALALLLFLIRTPRDPFAAKGELGPARAAVEIACVSSKRPVCRAGDTLTFQVDASSVAAGGGYLAAYAERTDGGGTAADHAPIWYFPNADGQSPHIEPGTATVVLRQGVAIGSEHRPGRYRVVVWISRRPLSRAAVRNVGADEVLGRASLDLDIVAGR